MEPTLKTAPSQDGMAAAVSRQRPKPARPICAKSGSCPPPIPATRMGSMAAAHRCNDPFPACAKAIRAGKPGPGIVPDPRAKAKHRPHSFPAQRPARCQLAATPSCKPAEKDATQLWISTGLHANPANHCRPFNTVTNQNPGQCAILLAVVTGHGSGGNAVRMKKPLTGHRVPATSPVQSAFRTTPTHSARPDCPSWQATSGQRRDHIMVHKHPASTPQAGPA